MDGLSRAGRQLGVAVAQFSSGSSKEVCYIN